MLSGSGERLLATNDVGTAPGAIAVVRDSVVSAVAGREPAVPGPPRVATVAGRVIDFRAPSRGVVKLVHGDNDVRHLSPGVYLLRGRGLASPKVIINR